MASHDPIPIPLDYRGHFRGSKKIKVHEIHHSKGTPVASRSFEHHTGDLARFHPNFEREHPGDSHQRHKERFDGYLEYSHDAKALYLRDSNTSRTAHCTEGARKFYFFPRT
ncbi:hypothetical protein TNCV_398291 [Trichonephila clavipes]|nr:hypothetical protein TNCV_398291 [Trichonephila clavipes]